MKRFRFIAILLFIKHFCIKFVSAAGGSELKVDHHQLIIGHPADKGNCDNDCFSVVVEILHAAHKFHSAGQVLVSSDWFHKLDYPSINKFSGESIGLPLIVYSNDRNETTTSSPAIIYSVNRFTPSRFAHLQQSTFDARPPFITAQLRQHTWRKILYLTFRQGMRIRISDIKAPRKRAGLMAAWNTLTQQDLFIVTFNLVQLVESVAASTHIGNNGLNFPYQWGPRERSNYIWIGCSTPSAAASGQIINHTSLNSRPICIYSSRRSTANLLGHVSQCRNGALTIDGFHQLLGRQLKARDGRNVSQATPIPTKRREDQISSNDLEDSDISSSGGVLTRRRIDPVARKGFLYSSLVFITKKPPDSNNSPGGVWGPFSIASWLGILAAYTVTAIVFGLIKLVTMNNLENSWYDWIMSRLLSVMYDDEKQAGREEEAAQEQNRQEIFLVSSSTVGIHMVDENDNEIQRKGHSVRMEHGLRNEGAKILETRRISVRSSAMSQQPMDSSASEQEQEGTFMKVKCRQSRGKMSRTILYGTIRLMSFIILGLYEGNLYTTITFPKSKLAASFDELISSDKYLIKVSSEAAKLENITVRITGNVSFHQNDQVSSSSSSVLATAPTISRLAGASAPTEGRLVESVNILDCVNWVEAGPDPNHACVGYEFELRNLHKAQKSDKILVRSKQRLLKFGPGGRAASVMTGGGTISSSSSSSTSSMSARFLRSRRRGFTLFPGGFQISKWILESGILQLWSIVENAFMESVINPHWSDPFKVFTIRDYLGLFVVYSMLLILASIMFLLEQIVALLGKVSNSKWFINGWSNLRDKCASGGNGCKKVVGCHGILRASCKSFKTRGRAGRRSELELRRGKKYFRSWSPVNGMIPV